MQKLRRSRLVKFLAMCNVLLCTALIFLNIVGTFTAMSENLYYASREQLKQKVFIYLYDYTASDLFSYLDKMITLSSSDDLYDNYYKSEVELYQSKFSPEKSNIYFEITDTQGNILLKNENNLSDTRCFSFSSYYLLDSFDYYDNTWYDMTVYDYKNEDATRAYYNETTTYLERAEVETEEEIDSEAPVGNGENTTDGNESVTDNSSYILYETDILNGQLETSTHVYYYYTGELDENIFQSCTDSVSDIPYEITSITFYQDEYEYSDGAVRNIYTPYESSVPKKTFTTQLKKDGKTADITYSYKGTFYDTFFTKQLSLTNLLLYNSDEDNLQFSYEQQDRIRVNISVKIPYVCTVHNDMYSWAENAVDAVITYKEHIVSITVLYFVLLIAALIFVFYSAGYIPKHELPVARALHALPFDLVCIFSIALLFVAITFCLHSSSLLLILGIILAVLTLFGFVYTTTVRVRAQKSLKTSMLIYKLYRFNKNMLTSLSASTSMRTRTVLTAVIFLMLTLFELFVFVLFDVGKQLILLIILFFRILEVPLIVYFMSCLSALHGGAENISKGNFGYKIKDTLLFGQFKLHAQYLNNINDTINSAVEERMRSENLKTELITNVSHDLKTPLTSIVNYVDLLKKENIDSPKALEYIEVIDRQSQRLKKLTIDIVEASKAATGNIEMHPEVLKLNVILLQTNGEYIEKLEEKKLALVQEIPEEDIPINADGRLLWRVIDNLMNNICKYSLPGTRVYLNLYRDENYAVISFRNISKNRLNFDTSTLTERFVRGDSSRNTEGSGLGLSIANSLTELMNGKLQISVDGDLFKVTLYFPTL